MKCQNKTCAFETKESIKFCPECGSKLVSSKDLVVICAGKLEDGSSCNTELNLTQKFCANCGTRVDPLLFSSVEDTCNRCETVFQSTEVFCGECGLKKGQPYQRLNSTNQGTSSPATTVVSVGNDSQTGRMDGSEQDDVKSDSRYQTGLLKMIEDKTAHSDPNLSVSEQVVSSTFTSQMDVLSNDSQGDDTTVSLEDHVLPQQRGILSEENSGLESKSKVGDLIAVEEGGNCLWQEGMINLDPINQTGPLNIIEEVTDPSINLLTAGQNEGSKIKSQMDESSTDKLNNDCTVPENQVVSKQLHESMPIKNPDLETKSNAACAMNIEDDSQPILNENLNKNNISSMHNQSEFDTRQNCSVIKRPLADGLDHVERDVHQCSFNGDSCHDLVEQNVITDDAKMDITDGSDDLQQNNADDINEDLSKGTFELENQKDVNDTEEEKKGQKRKKKETNSMTKADNNGKKQKDEKQIHQSNVTDQNETEHGEINPSIYVGNNHNNNNNESDFVFGAGRERTTDECNQSSKHGAVPTLFCDESSYLTDVTEQETKQRGKTAFQKVKNFFGFGKIKDRDAENVENDHATDKEDSNKSENSRTRNPYDRTESERSKEAKNNQNKKTGKTGHDQQKQDVKSKDLRDTENKQINQQSKATESQLNRTIDVHFHIFVSEEFEFDPAKQDVILRIGKESLGGWTKKDRVMKMKGKVTEKIYEMEYYLKMPADTNLRYKYCIMEKMPDGNTPKYTMWENYIKDGKQGERIDRHFHILNKWNKLDVWHQFDGFIERKPTGWYDQIKDWANWRTKLIGHVKMSLQICGQSIFREDKMDTPIQDSIEIIFHGHWKVYCQDAKCWGTTMYQKDFKKEFGGHLISTLIAEAENKEGHLEQKITLALSAVYAIKYLEIGIIDHSKIKKLCKALLMDNNSVQTKYVPELQVAERLFPGEKKKKLADAILEFATSIAETTKDPSWLFLMPWIHFLHGSIDPFDIPDIDINHDGVIPKWWGIDKIGENPIEYFKGKTDSWEIAIRDVLQNIQPLFCMDYLLPRTFMTCIELKYLNDVIQTDLIPLEVILATNIYYLKITRPRYFGSYGCVTQDEQKVSQCLSSTLKCMRESTLLEQDEKRLEMRLRISKQLLGESCVADRDGLMAECAQIFTHCMALYDTFANDQQKQKGSSFNHMKLLQEGLDEVLKWMKYYCYEWNTYLEQYLQTWNHIVAPQHLQSAHIRDTWNNSIHNSLSKTMQLRVCNNEYNMTSFVDLYCRKADIYSPYLQECLSAVAFESIAAGYTIDYGKFTEEQNRRFGKLLSDFFVVEWTKSVENEAKHEDQMILRHILQWPPFAQFVKINYTDEKMRQLLSESCILMLVKSDSVIQSKVMSLISGTITVKELELISENETRFTEVAELLKMDKMHTKDFLKKAIMIRKREIKAFCDQAELMTTLTALCSQLHVDVDSLNETLNKQNELQSYQVKEFCKPSDIRNVIEEKKFTPEVSAFKVSKNVLDILPDLHMCNKSSIFLELWGNQCMAKNIETLDEVVTEVWMPVKQKWDNIAKSIQNGSITFQGIEKFIGKMYKEDYDTMKEELFHLNMNTNDIYKRISQIKKYRQLEDCVKGAKVILKFQREFNLTGDFRQIQVIAKHNQIVMEMGSFDDSVMETCDFLKEVTDKKAKSLDTFVRCGPLVTWLRESMKSGLKELKVFVDLASISAGDEPLSINKVHCLHSAVTGFAPLIFDLTENAGYKELIEICRIVWKEMVTDPKLPIKLMDTNRHLEWLKDIKKAHGSVEVNSLVQSAAINATGRYTVGRNAYKDKIGDDNTLDLAKSLNLTVPKEEKGEGEEGERKKKQKMRDYTFENLQDLQSRLMLVAGKAEKGSDNVDRFTSIFDSVIRLASVNIKLRSAGCVLFKDWTATFLCDKSKPVCSILDFGQGEGSLTLKAKRSETEDLVAIIPKIAKFMEQCLEDWLGYIKEKRKKYLHLNFFTIDQLVILQRELVKMGTDDQPSIWIYPLLSAVKKNCTPDDLLGAMKDSKTEIDSDADLINVEEEEAMIDESNVEENEDELRQKFIDEVMDAGYSRKLTLLALKHIAPDQVEDGVVWCMNHEDMDDDISVEESDERESELSQTQTTTTPRFEGWSQSTTSIQSLIRENIEGLKGTKGSSADHSLLEDLLSLWGQFLSSMSSNIKDYLSLEHLGIILEKLAARETTRVFRKFPPGFQEGSPNLIICPQGELLNTTLSLYMLEKNQPLPQSDEILMCTPHTTTDEVDIFWRRAIFGGGKKIHCLVNADCLDFDVSDAAERHLEQYIQETSYTDNRYRLVVVCGSDNEYRSRIVASLDKHRRPALPLSPVDLREYLARKLQQGDVVNGIKPASFVDFDRSTIRVVKSWRAGVGKTLYKSRRETDLERLNGNRVKVMTIPLQEKVIDLHYVITRLLGHTSQPGTMETRLFHIDVAHEVQEGVDYLLFNLLVLGCLTDKTGFVWRRCPTDLYLIETLPLMILSSNSKKKEEQYVHQMFNILPDMTCRSPQESLEVYSEQMAKSDYMEYDQLFDEEQFCSSTFQRPFQYLCRLDEAKELNDVRPDVTEGTKHQCLQTLLRHCGVNDPSWAELHHFVWFLNTQLLGFESSAFVKAVAAEDLPGFAKFVLRFLIQMSKDFSTRSLKMSEESPGMRVHQIEEMETPNEEADDENGALNPYQLRRTWESSPHPYIFFNADNITFTFLGFYIEKATGNLIDQQTGQVLEERIMQRNLYDSLVGNFVPIQENFDQLPRHQKIMKMCNVMGIDMVHDPDDTYELTTDNVKKIMAIYMRFRCDIPVIIMGETGCGKTRLVKFMCGLQVPPGMEGTVTNMILMKVHGGTTNADIIKKVKKAEEIARKNVKEVGPHMFTVLFFDEANTTESIGLIKEIMCDKSMEGRKLTLCENLKMVAACNPYRKHSQDLIKKLEQAGLGYHVDADNTRDKLGRVPMRQLVYRVQPLPQSLLPLVWDFGQLNTLVEDLYIRQMVRRCIRDKKLPDIPKLVEVVSAILTASQDYMRKQKDECSFVSLRDVERVLRVMSWFYKQSQEERTLFDNMDNILNRLRVQNYNIKDEEEEEDDMEVEGTLDDITRSLVLSLGVCYHACLKTRDNYREHIAQHFRAPCALPGGPDQIEEEINICQDVFLENVQLENNIAKNMALKENLFMMVVCIELRIPLFLVGKPGSSKSLAKTIVSDAMQGNASRETLFKELKQVQMVSFQCSPLSTPDGIVGTFRQCAQFQKDKDLDTFVSIVVLDEVGLAEDSPRMPLKTLHPLLEDGCQGDEKPEPFMKVAFIGISNWALDPAKMNRGILVQREVPDLDELINSARGICAKEVIGRIEPLIKPMCISYLDVFKSASTQMREFYGLRDFYSLVKMVCSFTEKSKQMPTWHEMLHAIRRNFGGLEQQNVDPEKFFKEKLASIMAINDERKESDPDCTAAGLIEACLFERNISHSESRYLLLLTENYGSLTILQQQIFSIQKDIKPITIFGSSFRSDQEYTQVCRNINKIKVCMETGNTVVLLNLENLYESLYDALNQYYVYFGGERYVDLGLGTHRVKCPVHKKFRLIVVAEKQTVYEKFPIPLINRLEKHFLTTNTMLTPAQQTLAKSLEEWAKSFSAQNEVIHEKGKPKKVSQIVGDVFMGFHEDTCSAIILHVWKNTHQEEGDLEEILREAKSLLLWVTTPQAVVRLNKSDLPVEEQRELEDIYLNKQKHDSIVDYLHQKLVVEQQDQLFVQVTTHSKLLATYHKREISERTNVPLDRIMLLDTLSSFDTEQQFSNKIQQHLQNTRNREPCLLIIQCDSGDINANLVACARYCVMDEYQKVREDLTAPVHVVFIVQLPNIVGGCYTGFQCGVWHSVHIDDLWIEDTSMPSIKELQNKSVSNLIQDAVKGHVSMETNDEEETRDTSETMDWQVEENITTDIKQVEGMEIGEPVASSSHHLERVAPKGPLDIHEVIIGFEMAGMENGVLHTQTGSGKSLNVKNLIISCTQEALSMLKDKSENTKRTTERVSLVLTLFHGKHLQGYELFLHGMCFLIANLLKEKDKNDFGAENWLTNEAARQENIQKAGTFRRSCLQTLTSKISPILAGIIAHLDANQNLDILEDNQSPWKQEMWLDVLNVPEALQLKYSDLRSPSRQSELYEVVVMTTGCEGCIFKAEMPFSWLIQQQLIEILRTPMPEDEEKPSIQATIDFYKGVFEKTSIGKVLTRFSLSDHVTEMADIYFHDFMCMCYKAFSEDEFQLVSQSIKYLYNQMANEYDFGTLSQLLLCIHESYKTLAPRLSYFHTMNMVWPECSATIVKHKQEQPDHPLFQEDEYTFSTLCLLIDHLTPTKPELDQTASRYKWLNKVHTFRPVIEKVLLLHAEDAAIYGVNSYRSVHRARCLWNRVVVIKLFLEHVCVVEAEVAITVKQCMPLWKVLTDEANLKELKSLGAIEKILRICNRKAIKTFLGKQETCCYCDVAIEGPPIVLPCSDIFCDECYHSIMATEYNSCPKCQASVPSDWTLKKQTQNMTERKKLTNYQKRCNAFFMDVVSQLCFYDNTPPTDDVIDRLLEYITYSTKGSEKLQSRKVTKEMTIFNTGLDPNPVFRSFLLQLLMRTSEEKVMENIRKYLQKAEALLNQPCNDATTNEIYTDLCLLVIQCLEDILIQKLSISADKVAKSTRCLKNAKQTILTDGLDVEKLYGLAEARIGLAEAAKALADLVQQKGRTIATNVRRLLEAAQDLCENEQTDYPRIYLVKYICRRFGINVYQEVCRSEIPFLLWIGKGGSQENKRLEISDRYVLCGETYTQIREALTKVLLGEEIQYLDETLQELRTPHGHTCVMLQLAIYREITCSLLYPQQQRKVTDKEVGLLQNYIKNSQDIKTKDLLQNFLDNTLGQTYPHLTVTEGIDFRDQGLQTLLTHYLSVFSQLQGDRTLLHPLIGVMVNPQAYVMSFIPTMPQDELDDVRKALLAAKRSGNETPVLYRCPNGHLYVIGDCGRPYVVDRCKCGAEIGGSSHNLLPTNTKDEGIDETQTGHILGHAQNRDQGPRPERQMTPLYCACVRLFTHLSMYLGISNDAQALQSMIRPTIQVNEVPEYLWHHIQKDMDDLQRCLERSIDDTFLLLHAIIDGVMRSHHKGAMVKEEIYKWNTKQGRNDWEIWFVAQYLQPVIKDCDKVLQQANQKIVNDHRLGADPLLCLLNEIDTQPEPEILNNFENCPAVWRYRSQITLGHLIQEFEAKKAATGKHNKQLSVLDLFLKEEHYLRAIRCIPSILRLQRELFQKYQRKLEKAEIKASQITIGLIKKEKVAGEDTDQLVEDFELAWNICWESLKKYLCPTELGGMVVPEGYCKPITDDTLISVLLPAIKEEGLCSYALLDFLMRKQNDFLDKCATETTRDKERTMEDTARVLPMEVTSAHLISYNPQQDLLPLILANCQYSFEIGKGTKIEYDFISLERQIMDRFLFSKSKIDVGPFLQIDLMIYTSEFTDGETFKKLGEMIEQESLSSAVKTQICQEMKSLPELCQSLNNLDITISFLKSIGGNPGDSLQRFMSETLQMKITVQSQKARQTCLFKHIQALWLLLALEKSKKMAEHRQPIENICESVNPDFLLDLPKEIESEFREFMSAISIEKLSELVSTLHEYILLRVAVRENRDDEDYVDTRDRKLRDWLIGYSEDQDRTLLEQILPGFPETILYKHCVHTWVTAYSMLYEKQTGDQKF